MLHVLWKWLRAVPRWVWLVLSGLVFGIVLGVRFKSNETLRVCLEVERRRRELLEQDADAERRLRAALEAARAKRDEDLRRADEQWRLVEAELRADDEHIAHSHGSALAEEVNETFGGDR